MSFENGQITVETIAARNLRIMAEVDAGMLPVLPFEILTIEESLNEALEDQSALAQELSVVNHQGSENYHDNFAANQVEWDSMVVKKRGINAVTKLDNSIVFDYPPEGEEVTLGSVMQVKFGSSDAQEVAVLLGTIAKGDALKKVGLPEDAMIATIRTDLGKALLGARAGDTVAYSNPSGRLLEISVIAVTQLQTA